MSKKTTKSNYFLNRHPAITLFITTVFLTVFLCVLLDFIAGQLFLPKTGRIPSLYYHHDLKKNIQIKETQIKEPWGHMNYILTTNSLGFKDEKKRNIDLLTSKYRILFIGDSVTEGVGYPYNLTFVSLFTKKLNGEHYEVLNAAAISYSPRLYYLKLKYLIESKKLKINELFVFIDISDIIDEIVYKEYNPGNFRPILSFLLRKFFLITKIKEQIQLYLPQRTRENEANCRNNKSKWTLDHKIFNLWGKTGLGLADQQMELIFQLCNKYNIKMNIAVYPWPEQIINKDLNSIQAVHWKGFAQKRNIGFLDCFPIFINNDDSDKTIEKYFINRDMHLNENGHRLIADILYRYWEDSLKNSKNNERL